jgi:hypothetical protein
MLHSILILILIDWRGPRHLSQASGRKVRKWEEWRTLSTSSARGQMHELSLLRRYDASLEWGSHGSSVLAEASV